MLEIGGYRVAEIGRRVPHWIDRRNLLRCVAEIDRVVAGGGYLVIGNFHPWHATRAPA